MRCSQLLILASFTQCLDKEKVIQVYKMEGPFQQNEIWSLVFSAAVKVCLFFSENFPKNIITEICKWYKTWGENKKIIFEFQTMLCFYARKVTQSSDHLHPALKALFIDRTLSSFLTRKKFHISTEEIVLGWSFQESLLSEFGFSFSASSV